MENGSESDWDESKWVMAAFSAASQVFTTGFMVFLLRFTCVAGPFPETEHARYRSKMHVYTYSILASVTKYNQREMLRQ